MNKKHYKLQLSEIGIVDKKFCKLFYKVVVVMMSYWKTLFALVAPRTR